MKKPQLFFILLISSFQLTAQDKKHQTDSVAQVVQTYFNLKDADKIGSMVNEQFKKAVPTDVLKSTLNNNLFPLGRMQAQFENNTNGISKYKATFTGATLSMLIGLDDTGKISTLVFRPYVDETKKSSVLSSNDLQTVLDKQVDSIAKPYASLAVNRGLSIGVLINDKMYFYGYGETAKDNKKLPDRNAIFEIGSISKTFTATLLAAAVREGKIKLDDPVNKFLPDSITQLQYEGVGVTIEMLSNHSSGIPRMPSNFNAYATDALNPYKNYNEPQLFSFYKNLKLARKPGSVYEYSNMAVATLGVILEKIYKKSYEQLVIEKICQPLGMNDTRQFIRPKDSTRFVKGYDETGKYNGQWDFKAFAAAGAIRSTAADMLKYAKANMGEAPATLSQDIQLTHSVTFTYQKTKLGLGWHYIKPGSDEILFHNGGTGGFRSYLGINQNKKFAVVILSNTANSVDLVGNELMKLLEK